MTSTARRITAHSNRTLLVTTAHIANASQKVVMKKAVSTAPNQKKIQVRVTRPAR